MERRVTTVVVAPEGSAIFDERGFTVSIEDDGAGEFVKVMNNCGEGTLAIDPADWPALSEAIACLLADCRS